MDVLASKQAEAERSRSQFCRVIASCNMHHSKPDDESVSLSLSLSLSLELRLTLAFPPSQLRLPVQSCAHRRQRRRQK